QPKAFVEACEPRLIVLVRISLPAVAAYQGLDRLLLLVRHIVKRLHDSNALEIAIIDAIGEYVGQRKRLEFALAKSPVNVAKIPQIGSMVVPLERLLDALRRVVRAGQDVLDSMFGGEVVHASEERVVLRRVDVWYLRLEESQLEILHLEPVDDL